MVLLKTAVNRSNFEASLQLSVIECLTRFAKPTIIWFHPANERRCSPRQGAFLKRMGVKAGVPDVCLVRPDGTAAFLELKSRDGRQTPEQIAFEQLCRANGSPYAIDRNIDEAISILMAWGCIKGPRTGCMSKKSNGSIGSSQTGLFQKQAPSRSAQKAGQ
jgi:hypothetical protein